MESKKEKVIAILSLIFFAGFLYIIWRGISFFIDSLISTNSKISAVIIGAMTTILVGITVTIITQRQIKLREIAEAHRKKKVEIYQKFISIVSLLIVSKNDQVTMKAPTEQELIDYMVNFQTDILLWGSPKVIKAQLEFKRVSAGSGGNILMAVNNLYKAIREDIGLSNTGLNNLELVKLYLKDPSELDKLK